MIQSTLTRILCGAALGTSLVAAPAFAGDKAKHDHDSHSAAEQSSVQGTVEAVSPRSITLKGSDGSSVKVDLDKKTQYDNGGKTGAVSDLRTGMVVTVQGEKQKDGTVRAESVRYVQPS
ncbi:MAG: hypothetical protein RL033_6852 [Pseudomonadota bacterium]|jgi:hypothetical protein